MPRDFRDFSVPLAALPAVALAAWVLLGWNVSSFLDNKVYLLAAQYFILAPVCAFYLWRYVSREGQGLGTAYTIRLEILLLCYCALTLPLAWALGDGVYQADESAYLFEARSLSTGSYYQPAPVGIDPSYVHFTHHIVFEGKVFGKYPLGWPALLAPFSQVGLAWILNPVLGMLLLWLTHMIGKEGASRSDAAYGALIMLLSPFFWLNSIGFMSHVLSGVLLAAATLALLKYWRSDSRSWLTVMLVFIGMAGAVRPFTTACIAVALCCFALWSMRRRTEEMVSFIAKAAVTVTVLGCWMAASNKLTTGSYSLDPYVLYDRLYLGSDAIEGLSFSPLNLASNVITVLPLRLGDTAATAFPFLFVLAIYACWSRRSDRNVGLLACVFGSLVVAYLAAEFHSDSPVGERYYFEGFFALAILGGIGWRRLTFDFGLSRSGQTALATALAMSALSVSVISTVGLWKIRWPGAVLARAADAPPVNQGIVFVVRSDVVKNLRAYNLNRPNSSLLYLPDPGPEYRALVAAGRGETNWMLLQVDSERRNAVWTQDDNAEFGATTQ